MKRNQVVTSVAEGSIIMFKLGLLFNKQRILIVLMQKEVQFSHNDCL